MLKPYACVACEKVIIAKDDVASLIGLFSKFVFTIPAETQIPRNAVAPKEWCVYSSWDPEPGDEQREYLLCTDILYPDKTQFLSTLKHKIQIEPNKRAQVFVNVMGFPISQTGEHTIRTWIELNDERVFGPIEFGIGLEIVRQEATQLPTAAPLNQE